MRKEHHMKHAFNHRIANCIAVLAMLVFSINAWGVGTAIASLNFNSPTSLPSGYTYSSSNSPSIATTDSKSCVTFGGAGTAPTFSATNSSAPTGGSRWMAFQPNVDCTVTFKVRAGNSGRTLYLLDKDHNTTSNCVSSFAFPAKNTWYETWSVDLTAGTWYAIIANNSNCYITSMQFVSNALPEIPADPTGTYHTYTVDNSTIFPNPERGFIEQLEAHINTGSANRYCVKGNEWYFEQTSTNTPNERLVLVLYYLDNFKSSNLPTEIINAFDEDMQVLRDYGFKCILRYAYCQTDNVDATKAQVLAHINQLKNKWAANKDVIYCFQAGFIGQWGEWYYTSHFTDGTSNMTSDRREVVDALLAALPSDVYIQLRTPFQKTQYLSDATPISSSNAFNGSTKSRLGHHNDAYLNGATNSGTYSSVSDTTTQKPYIATETLYVPIGGETNIESSSAASTYATREKTIAESSRLHYTFLKGGDWPSQVMTPWHSDGTYDELNKKLGYRYQLLNASYTNTANVGGTMHVHMNIKNVGFAPLYNERHAYIILTNASNTYSIQMTTDPRRWSPNGVITEIIEDLALPAGIVPGTYNIYLSLPDNHGSLASDPKYAVRFANTGIWDSTHGWNNLNASITVSAGATPTLSVSPTAVNFGDKTISTTHTNTITVSGSNLSANATVSSNNAQLTVSPSTITPAQASSGQTVTLSLTPTAAGSGSATVTIASSGATTKTVTVTWNGTTSASTVVDLPGTVDKSNYSTVSDNTWWTTNNNYYEFKGGSGNYTSRYIEWEVNVAITGDYLISEEYYCGTEGQGWEFKLFDTSHNLLDTYNTGSLERLQNTYATTSVGKWHLPAGNYIIRVRNVREWAEPKIKSITFTYDGEILPVEPFLDPDPAGTVVNYTADNSTIFRNPERGFLTMLERKDVSTSKNHAVVGKETYLTNHRNNDNGTLILVLYYLNNYKNTATLPAEVLQGFDEDMEVLRNYGMKAIVRFAYTYEEVGSDPDKTAVDAPLNIIEQHIAQYKSHWEANTDVIFVFQMGMIGCYGEWYYTSNFGNQQSGMNANRIALVDTMMKATPQNRCVQIRTPRFKTEYLTNKGLSLTPILYGDAYDGSIKSRLGHHNDAFLYHYDNMGTYNDTAVQKPYISRETFYVPIGGESDITDFDQATEEASYAETIHEMSYLHWTFIQSGYSTVVTNMWRGNGTFDELNRRLGYRYQLVNGTYSNTATVDGTMRVYMNIRNTGFAPLYNERHAYIVLKSGSNIYPIQLTSNAADPRRWRPNGAVTTIGEELSLAGIPAGTYNLYLYLPDAYSSLANRSNKTDYAIRFANTGVWDSATGMNNLNATITISAPAAPAVDLPGTVNKGNVSTYSGDMTWSGASNEYFDFGPTDASNLDRWAEWNVRLTSQGEYTVAVEVSFPAAPNGYQWQLQLLDGGNNVISTYESVQEWGKYEKTYTEKWNLTSVPTGVYRLRVKNIFGYAQPKLKSITLSLPVVSTYTVSYNAGSGAGITGSHANDTKTHDVALTLPGETFHRTGYTQTGWSTSNGGAQTHALGGSYTTNADQTFYPVWTVKTTTITINANTANHGSTTPGTVTATWGSALPSFTAASGASGYTLRGYYTAPTDGIKVINIDGTLVASTTYADGSGKWKYEGATLTLYAQYDAPTYVVFDNNNGTGDGNWSTATNWQGGALPTALQTARIIQPCTVDVNTCVAKNVLIATGSTYNGHLTIAPTGGLVVTEKIQKAVNGDYASPTAITASDLTIQASSAGQGALVLGTEDGSSQATVQMYSKAYIDTHKHWQYMGVPFSNTPEAQSLFSGGYMYRWNETTSAGWNTVSNTTTLQPFVGYCLSQPAAKTYEWTGTLCASTNKPLTVSYTSDGQLGANLFANSWTAPIEIANFENGDFSNAGIDKVIYIFNTGSRAEYDAIGGEANTGSSPGQFFAIPVHAAPYAVGLPTVIPPMQGFQIMTTVAGTLTLDYARLTAPYGAGLNTQPLKAPKSEERPDVLRLTVYGQSGQSSSDRFYLLTRSDCSENYDNGWDGKKILANGLVALYSVGAGGDLAVDTRSQMAGTNLTFVAGVDSAYTMEFYYTGSQTLYLFDQEAKTYTQLTDGASYTFDAMPYVTSARFRIVSEKGSTTDLEESQESRVKSEKFIQNGHLYLRCNGQLYDATGKRQ